MEKFRNVRSGKCQCFDATFYVLSTPRCLAVIEEIMTAWSPLAPCECARSSRCGTHSGYPLCYEMPCSSPFTARGQGLRSPGPRRGGHSARGGGRSARYGGRSARDGAYFKILFALFPLTSTLEDARPLGPWRGSLGPRRGVFQNTLRRSKNATITLEDASKTRSARNAVRELT